MEKYSLKMEKFSGPMEKLLELIEEKKLEISEINLAEITDDFLRYVESLKKDFEAENQKADPEKNQQFLRLIADFISVASRLILIKSKILLPNLKLSEEEEQEIKELEKQLQIYKDLKSANKIIQGLWRENNRSFSRPYLYNLSQIQEMSDKGGERFFYPGKKLTGKAILAAINKIFKAFESFSMETKTIKNKIVSLEEKIKEIVERLKEITETTFKNLVGIASKSHIVISFIAILHLAREQIIFLEQEKYFSDIIIKKK